MGLKQFIFGEGEGKLYYSLLVQITCDLVDLGRSSFILLCVGYEYGALCMPSLPWKKQRHPMRFYPLDEALPILLSLVMGLQHAFAMVGGLITPPFVIAKFSIDSFPFDKVELQQYFIVAALITSGICTIINVCKIEIPFSKKIFGRRLFIGSGLLSVMVCTCSAKALFARLLFYDWM
jgi:hypothetical protein